MYTPIKLGAVHEIIEAAERELGITFPDELKWIWRETNGLELPNDWMLFPVFDPLNPIETCNSIVYENTPGKRRWDYMSENLIAIASNSIGNCLVLKIVEQSLSSEILVWNHERNATKPWGKTLEYILEKAEAKVESVLKARAKSLLGMIANK